MPKSSTTYSGGSSPRKILFAASEALPLIKTGGLADVAGSLPPALSMLDLDVRLVIPAYPQAVERAIPLKTVATLRISGVPEPVRILEETLEEKLHVYLIDAPSMFSRPGNPYTEASGRPWGDNAQRFALFCRAVVHIALNQAGLGWHPDVVHCNDWQTGLVPALLAQEWDRPATIFTIHNLSYQGIFDLSTFLQLQLPDELWSPEGLEFHNQLSFIKGGLVFADWLTTVSPTYAEEIRSAEFGYGLEGLLDHRSDRLTGVLNGIDYHIWDPATDGDIAQTYDVGTFHLKQANKLALQKELGLEQDADAMLFGNIGRMVEQKGIDLVIEILPEMMQHGKVQLVILGSGEEQLEQALLEAAAAYPGRATVTIGYDETLAHRIEAGCDCFLMPSRYEPCGLNQLYSLRYGTVPIVNRTGGLADTVTDLSPASMLDETATGFVFDGPDAASLLQAVQRAIEYHQRPGLWWEKLATRGMSQDFSWDASASHYLDIYRMAVDSPAKNPVAAA
jgi:starch synthase